MDKYLPHQDVWDFEANYCRKPEAWVNQALNLNGNLEALILYQEKELDCIFNTKTTLPIPMFWSAGVQRMLIGYVLENLAKAKIMKDPLKAD